jgi:hypothetical protein
MLKVGFITCADLSKYNISKKNPLFTHDDQLACDFLEKRNIIIEPVLWGSNIYDIISQDFDLLIVRSVWDYANSEYNTKNFFKWLKDLENNHVKIVNNYDIINWNIDKRYLLDLNQQDIKIVPTEFLGPLDNTNKFQEALKNWEKIVVKPCISAGARHTFLLKNYADLENFLPQFELIRDERTFMIQPFVDRICFEGEWSLVFLNNLYSHAVLKKPQPGNWLVQDELGGSVSSEDPPDTVCIFAEKVMNILQKFLYQRFGASASLLYGRVDILPGLFLGELELFEPELFFLDRRAQKPNEAALSKFYDGVISFCNRSYA